MENEVICLDTSILIDFYRKRIKEKSTFYQLTKVYNLFAVSIITEYEIMIGAKAEEVDFWKDFFDRVTILPFDKQSNDIAIKITKELKKKNSLVEIPDIFIGATALARKIKIATLNKKHFERITDLELIEI
ncbi:type II toxin-antitoxin system VapC family toxin [Pedobacter zeae]|uniref:Ribonuclease VapC n=1 Tax=Pedobacter zeae TaxID=1737356 RepID=A0A7W6P793_9SPHI|nr:type II toxin-antitoxin system VapC family toxin [Pedobacter zeae]MBB4110539.1 putative nucleic acid-binding protein [Pedobacter zeae]GGH18509.1 PIN domain nuclease [Pedobacter zeae]